MISEENLNKLSKRNLISSRKEVKLLQIYLN
jgi:hypothetical protein